MTVQPAAARWTVSSRLGFIPNTHWQLGRTIDVPLGGTISRYAPTGFYSGMLHVLASALVTYFTAINCDFKQHFRTGLHVTGTPWGEKSAVAAGKLLRFLSPRDDQIQNERHLAKNTVGHLDVFPYRLSSLDTLTHV